MSRDKQTRLYFVRHGETEWNASRRLQGHADVSLSERGREQAGVLRPVIPALGPFRAVASDLKRVRETAELIGLDVDCFDPDLRENNVGDWTGRNFDELKSQHADAWADWRGGRGAPPNGETWDAFSARVIGAVTRHLGAGDGDVLVVCHGGVIRACLCHFLGLDPLQVISVAHVSLTAICLQESSPAKLELFNFTPDGPSLNAPH